MAIFGAQFPTRTRRSAFRVALPALGWPAFILLIAAIPRLGWLDWTEFKTDESAALALALGIARGQSLPLIGIGSSLGVPNQPFFVYLMALPSLLSPDPRLATALIGALGAAAVLATFVFAARYFDRVTASAAALFFAVSPWSIIYSRKVWEQDALPFFVILGFFALFGALLEGKRWWIVPGLALFTLAIQLHPTGYFLILPAGLLILGCLFGDQSFGAQTWRWLLLGIGAALVLEAPYLTWQARHGWPLIATFLRLTGDAPVVDLSAVRLARSVAAGNGYPTLAIVNDLWQPAEAIETVLLLGGIGLAARRGLGGQSRSHRFAAFALLTWLAAPVVFQTRHAVPLYPHYFIVLYPAPFLLMGLAVSALAKAGGRTSAVQMALGQLPVLLSVGFGIVAFGTYISALSRGALSDTFGVPLGAQQAWVKEAGRRAGDGPVYFGGHSDLAASFEYLTEGRWRIFNDLQGLPLPSAPGPSLLILADSDSSGVQQARRLYAPAQPVIWPLPGGPTLLVYSLDSGTAPEAAGYRAAADTFENRMRLVGYRITASPNQTQIWIDLRWRFDGPVPAKSPTVFNHLLDQRGETVGQIDGLALTGQDHRPGEDLINTFTIPRPQTPGPYTLQIGLYDYPSMERFRRLNPEPGTPRDAITLATFE